MQRRHLPCQAIKLIKLIRPKTKKHKMKNTDKTKLMKRMEKQWKKAENTDCSGGGNASAKVFKDVGSHTTSKNAEKPKGKLGEDLTTKPLG